MTRPARSLPPAEFAAFIARAHGLDVAADLAWHLLRAVCDRPDAGFTGLGVVMPPEPADDRFAMVFVRSTDPVAREVWAEARRRREGRGLAPTNGALGGGDE